MKKILTTPIKAEDLQDIRVGDVIYLTGTLVTCRDVCHRRLIELKRPIPYDLNGKAIFHAGPIVRKNGDKWEMVSVGPTTSMRMESFEREFIEQTGVKLVVGKGGMGPLTEEGCQKFKALHVIFPAGCAVLAATQVEAPSTMPKRSRNSFSTASGTLHIRSKSKYRAQVAHTRGSSAGSAS